MSQKRHNSEKTAGDPVDYSKPLRLAAHEAFAQLCAKGVNQSAAFRQVYPKSKRWKDDAVYANSSALSRKVSVRIDLLKQAGASKTILTVERKLEMLATRTQELYNGFKGVMKILPDGTQVIDVDDTNAHLIRKATVRVDSSGRGDGKSDAAFVNAEIQDWLDPMREHSKLAGDYPAEKREITGKDGKDLPAAVPVVLLIDRRAV